jgi:hydroxymethylbilane synthase
MLPIIADRGVQSDHHEGKTMNNPNYLRFGTRGSALALWQTRHVIALIMQAHPGLQADYEIIATRGDQLVDTPLALIGGKGVFTAELETALHERRIDGAVHSLKDLPTAAPAGLVIGAIPTRGSAADVLISRGGYTLDTLPDGARVGTSSARRAAQLLRRRPDLRILNLRGNIDTRLRKALAEGGDYDALVLARAGLERLERLDAVSETLPFDVMLPAPGQGALAVQTRIDPALVAMFAPIHHLPTALAVTAERAFLAGLGGGCAVPVAAYADWHGDHLLLRGRVSAPDGSQQIDAQVSAAVTSAAAAVAVGTALAQQALDGGAKALMAAKP